MKKDIIVGLGPAKEKDSVKAWNTRAYQAREAKLVAALMKVLLIAVSNDYSYIKKIVTTTLTELGYND